MYMVKFTALILFCLLSVNALLAQTEKGDWVSGSSIYFSSSSSEGITPSDTNITSSVNFNITAFGGYFIADNVCVGLGIGFTRNSATNNYAPIELTDISSTIAVELLTRYYYLNNERIKLWAGAGAQVGFGTYDDHNFEYDDQGNVLEITNTDKINTFSFGFGPGVSIMLTQQLALEVYYGSIGYSKYTLKREDGSYDYTTNSFGLSLANTFGFGIAYHFIK